jgi:sugar phosphate isomerase/epimerase
MYKLLDTNLLRIPGTVFEIAPLAVKYGFEGISVPKEILLDKRKAEEAGDCIREYGLKWGLLQTPVDFFHEDIEGSVFEEALEMQKKWAEVGEKLGVKYAYNHVWPTSSKREFNENFEWHVDRLRRIQSIFKSHGIKYGLEFLGPKELRTQHKHTFVHTISGVLAIADAAGGESGFLFDTYHWYCGSGRLDDLYYAAKNCGRMVNLHLNDGVAGVAPDEQRDLIRAMPMSTGVIDSAMIYRTFKENGYQGPAMCEPMAPTTDRFAALPAEQSTIEVMETFKKLEMAN